MLKVTAGVSMAKLMEEAHKRKEALGATESGRTHQSHSDDKSGDNHIERHEDIIQSPNSTV